MATRYLVSGGNGNWSSTTNWSATSGGASGASVPGSSDTVICNAASGAGGISLDRNFTIISINVTGWTGFINFATYLGATTRLTLNGTGAVLTGSMPNASWPTGFPGRIVISSTGSTAITVDCGSTTSPGWGAVDFYFTGGTYALTLSNFICNNLDFTGYAGAVSNASNFYFNGNLTLSSLSGFSIASGVANTSGVSGVTQVITSNGKPLVALQLGTGSAASGTCQLSGALTVTNGITLSAGTLDLNGNNLTCATFNSATTTYVRGISFGSNSITCNGSGTVWNTGPFQFTITGTPVVNISNNSISATTVTTGSMSEANSISFNFTVGSYVLTSPAGNVFRNLSFTGFAGSLAGGTQATIYGDLTLSSTITVSTVSAWTFASTSATTRVITTNSTTVGRPLVFNGVGGSWRLADALLMNTTRALTHTNGTLDLNGKTLTVGTAYTTTAGTKNLTFNGGTLVCPGTTATAFNNNAPINFTTTAGTGVGKIAMTAATAKTFVGGGSTYNCTLSNDGAGALTISGSNTFTTIANGVQPTAFTFTAGTTQTVTNWNVSGTAGNLVTIISSTAGVPALLSKASGTVSSNYLSLKDSTALGGAAWYAGANSTNVSGNLGWIFSNAANGNFFFMF